MLSVARQRRNHVHVRSNSVSRSDSDARSWQSERFVQAASLCSANATQIFLWRLKGYTLKPSQLYNRWESDCEQQQKKRAKQLSSIIFQSAFISFHQNDINLFTVTKGWFLLENSRLGLYHKGTANLASELGSLRFPVWILADPT